MATLAAFAKSSDQVTTEPITVNPATVHPLRHQLAKRLRALRETRGWSQARLAEASGLHRTYVSLIERARCSVSLDSLARLAQALEVPAFELLSEKSTPESLIPAAKSLR